MKKNRRKSRPKKPRSRLFSVSAPAVLAYLEQADGLSPAQQRALRSAVPRRSPLHSSNWVDKGTARGAKASGLSSVDVIDVLEGFFRWCHREGSVAQHDAAIHLAQLELLRRKHGAEPATVALPERCELDTLNHDQLREIVAQWEAMSYAAAAAGPDPDVAPPLLYIGALEVLRHLYIVDGLPARLDRLDPADYALHVDTWHNPDNPFERPEGYTATLLHGTALLYEHLAVCSHVDRKIVDHKVAQRVAATLHALSLGYREPDAAA